MDRWPAKLVLLLSAAITAWTFGVASPLEAGESDQALQHVSRELQALEVEAGERRQALADLRHQLKTAKQALDRLGFQEMTPAAGPAEPAVEEHAADGAVGVSPRDRRVHLASFRTRQQAEDAWRRLKQRHGDVLRGLEPTYQAVDFGPPRGLFQRLVIDVAPERQTCRLLRERGAYCQPVS